MAEPTKPGDEDPIDIANDMLRKRPNRTISPASDAVEGAAGHVDAEAVEGQLGPDEISEPEEVVMNNEAKHHH